MTIMSNKIREALDEPYALTEAQVHFYRENGFVKLKNVLSPDVLAYMDIAISSEVKKRNTQQLPLEKRDTYGKAFLQVMNLWTTSEFVKEIVFSKRLAQLATELMEVDGVRMYHDQALNKEPGGGFTPWHADQYYWPLATEKSITLWAPLQSTPLECGPLEFSAQSNRFVKGHNMKISDESQQLLEDVLAKEGFKHVVEPFESGEVSFHAGWLYHRAGPNRSGNMRKVMTVIYMDKDMKLKEPEHENQILDWEVWCPGARIGEVIKTSLNPILYEKRKAAHHASSDRS